MVLDVGGVGASRVKADLHLSMEEEEEEMEEAEEKVSKEALRQNKVLELWRKGRLVLLEGLTPEQMERIWKDL